VRDSINSCDGDTEAFQAKVKARPGRAGLIDERIRWVKIQDCGRRGWPVMVCCYSCFVYVADYLVMRRGHVASREPRRSACRIVFI